MQESRYEECIKACLLCASACNHCASSCLLEKDLPMMVRCIQLDMECEVICYAAARLMSLGAEQAMELCRICSAICEACGAECGKHDNDHCRKCSEICYQCSKECRKMAA